MTKRQQQGRAVLVTTAHRGVFLGYATNVDGETICLHATLKPSQWKGERLWIVALEEPVIGNADKMGALKREIICEVKLIGSRVATAERG